MIKRHILFTLVILSASFANAEILTEFQAYMIARDYYFSDRWEMHDFHVCMDEKDQQVYHVCIGHNGMINTVAQYMYTTIKGDTSSYEVGDLVKNQYYPGSREALTHWQEDPKHYVFFPSYYNFTTIFRYVWNENENDRIPSYIGKYLGINEIISNYLSENWKSSKIYSKFVGDDGQRIVVEDVINSQENIEVPRYTIYNVTLGDTEITDVVSTTANNIDKLETYELIWTPLTINSAIDQIFIASDEEDEKYYDLMGNRIGNPKSGFYIKVKNSTSSKVLLH